MTRTYESTSGDPNHLQGRPNGFQLASGHHVTYGYQGDGRLNTVHWLGANPGETRSATYTYLPNAHLLHTTTIADTTGGINRPISTATRTYEPNRDLITSLANTLHPSTGVGPATLLSEYAYTHNKIGNRTSMANRGTAFDATGGPAFSLFDYNDKNEVIQSLRYTGTDLTNTNNPVPAEARRYNYDHIGNRKTAQDSEPSQPDFQLTTYDANQLNQYINIATNGTPQTPPTYDADGNTTTDDRWEYTWNAENRLIQVQPIAILLTNNAPRVSNIYDYMGRRCVKTVHRYDITTGTWQHTETRTFTYEGWRWIEETIKKPGESNEVHHHTWGLDLSLSIGGAGDTGGILSSEVHRLHAAPQTRFYICDASGNITSLHDEFGELLAQYQYDVFGQIISTFGSEAVFNTFRFSSRFSDLELGFTYYGYRFYSSKSGRWLSRDPLVNCTVNCQNDHVGVVKKRLIHGIFLEMLASSGNLGSEEGRFRRMSVVLSQSVNVFKQRINSEIYSFTTNNAQNPDYLGLCTFWQGVLCVSAIGSASLVLTTANISCVLAFIPGEGGGVGDIAQIVACAGAVLAAGPAIDAAIGACKCDDNAAAKLKKMEKELEELKRKLRDLGL